MDTVKLSAEQLRERIAKAEEQLKTLKEQLAQVDEHTRASDPALLPKETENGSPAWKWPLTAEEYDRYGRQLILPNVGIHGQQRLKSSKILIIGGGGLGCPAASYIAGAGVGTLGIVDGDVVEPSNLHRQIAHRTSRVGSLKVDSLVAYCKELNPLPTYVPHREHLTPQNAQDIVSQYDLVLDCTDHPTSRYLISDICVLLQKPLVSASALRTDGQLIVLNCPPAPQGTTTTTTSSSPTSQAPPCYRCVFPRPPPPESVVSCGEGGVLGPVVGVMGVLQALEAIKIISAGLHVAGPVVDDGGGMAAPTLLLFSGSVVGAPGFRSVRMRGRRKDCFACGEGAEARLTLDTLRGGGLDYIAFCGGMINPVRLLADEERVSPKYYKEVVLESGVDDGSQTKKHLLLDVREKELFDICHIDGAINVPYSRIQSSSRSTRSDQVDGSITPARSELPGWMPSGLPQDAPIYVVCRVGNDSQLVAKRLKDLERDTEKQRFIWDIKGGMRAWKDQVDKTLPFM